MWSELPLDGAGLAVRHWRAGTGLPLVWLHGLGGVEAVVPALERLARRFEVVAPVHPGFDGSEPAPRPADRLDLHLLHLEHLDRLLGREGWRRALLVGHCFGGETAAALAAAEPAHGRLVMAAPLGLWLEAEPAPDVLSANAEELAALEWHDLRRAPGGVRHDPEAATIRAGNRTAAADRFWPLPDGGLDRLLPRVRRPTLVLRGADDRVVGAAQARHLVERLPDARLETLSASGHLPMLERPDAFDLAVARFAGAPA